MSLDDAPTPFKVKAKAKELRLLYWQLAVEIRLLRELGNTEENWALQKCLLSILDCLTGPLSGQEQYPGLMVNELLAYTKNLTTLSVSLELSTAMERFIKTTGTDVSELDMPDQQSLLNDSGCSFWLRDQITKTKGRDVVDVLNDVDLLSRVLHTRYDNTISNVR
jgi:hypothetical protein